MQKVLTAEQMREVDRLTTEKYGIPSIILMENAAHATARVITEKLGGSVAGRSILILCGKGNNGGDGAALARILSMQGAYVDVLLFGKIKETKGDARINFGVLCQENFEFDDVFMSNFGELREIGSKEEWVEFYMQSGQECDVVVDALFGTGVTRPLDVWLGNVVHDLNFVNDDRDSAKPRLCISVDLPSGLNADLGSPIGETVRADVTVTFTAPKAANVLPGVAAFNGELVVADIGSPEELITAQASQLYVAEAEDAEEWLEKTRFSDDSYKNKRGHTLIVAGSESYSGAAVLSGNAAMRSGVGLVTVAAPEECKAEIASRLLPDVILTAIDSEVYPDILAKANSIAVGCGLSATDEGIEKAVRGIVGTREKPVIVDAGALWFFNPPAGLPTANYDQGPLILTPHEGEFLRLLGTGDKDAIKDRVAAVRDFATKYERYSGPKRRPCPDRRTRRQGRCKSDWKLGPRQGGER